MLTLDFRFLMLDSEIDLRLAILRRGTRLCPVLRILDRIEFSVLKVVLT